MENSMTKAMRQVRRWCAVGTLAAAVMGCSSSGKNGGVEVTHGALATSNGLAQNGLATNGLWNNGLATNGLWNNGLWNNGLWNNGLWNNGLWNNGLWNNGLWNNGLWNNGLWNNGLWNNGLWNNGVWAPGQTGAAALPGDELRSSGYARQLLQYIYSCAMPPVVRDTTLDPNNGALTCAPAADGGAPDGGAGTCDFGYTCSNQGTCVIPLVGSVGVGVNADGTTWWESGTCDESCQRWVSACVLARTNAYGVHVEISMRAPAVAPVGHELQFAKIQAALATTSSEVTVYNKREGAYYGNIFQTTPMNADGTPSAPPPPVPPATAYSGPATGYIASTPAFYACAGPDSNTPEITKRFCSSQGDQSVITVPGTCISAGSEVGVCDGMDATGSIHGCYTSKDATTRVHFDEVITVFLAQPVVVCGNDVCEDGESSTDDPGYCPSDCHTGAWARLVNGNLSFFNVSTGSAIDPVDGSVVLVGVTFGSDTVVVDNTVTPPISLPPTSDIWRVIVAKYDVGGHYQWANSYGANTWRPIAGRVAVGSDESIYVTGRFFDGVASGGAGTKFTGDWFTKFTKDGALVTPLQVIIAHTPTANPDGVGVGHIRVTSQGDAIISGTYVGATDFGSAASLANTGTPNADIFVEKVCGVDRPTCPLGSVAWVQQVGIGEEEVPSIAVDGNDDVLVAGWSDRIYKLSGTTGTRLPFTQTSFFSVNGLASDPTDANHDVYATGDTGSALRIVKYSSDGKTTRWVKDFTPQCFGPATGACNHATGLAVTFDGSGQVIAGGQFGGYEIIDLGSGPLTSYKYQTLFIAGFGASDGTPNWAKGVPMILGGPSEPGFINFGYLSFGQFGGRVLLGGTFGGSMQLDGRLLESTIPESTSEKDPFLGVVSSPSLSDVAAPALGAGTDSAGEPIGTIPQTIVVQATSAAGANVFYMPPTATDDGNSGATVTCTPAPNTLFPIGSTPVKCSAADPLGNRTCTTCTTFTVVVTDTQGPAFTPMADMTVAATGAGTSASVMYTPPTARDQISGPAAVTCTPPPGNFPAGTTKVVCTASDASSNQSQLTFSVTVTGSIGQGCQTTADCPAGTCVDKICCATPSCGPCQACNVAGSLGTCAPSSGGACDDGNACTQGDTCQNGVCTGSASTMTCAPPDQCHAAGTCNPADGTCSNVPLANGTPCNDGNACTQNDTCQAGVCTPGAAATTCPAPDQCHAAGTCDPVTGACTSAALANGTPCNDGNACTQSDTCQSGVCTGGASVTCAAADQCHAAGTCNPATGTCTSAALANGTPCSDGNACTQGDTCQGGSCTSGAPVTCAAPDQCHTGGTCNPATGTCSNSVVANGTPCNDGNACTLADTCQAGTCTGGAPVTCPAADQCHLAGVCNPASGACSVAVAPDGTACNDGNACTTGDACNAGACTPGAPKTCAPADQCHVAGTCDSSTGLCSNPAAPNGTACNDGNVCTTSDACSAGACVGGAPKSCDDGNACTTDSCNPTSGCVNTPSGSGPPKLNPGTNQTVVGTCSSSTPVPFTLPTLASSSCAGTATISCTAVLGGGHLSCGSKDAHNGTLPGNAFGAYTVTCTAKDTSGHVSPAVSFTVTVLQPITVRVQPPLSGDNDSVDNVVKVGSTVPTKVQLFACGSNVTTRAAVTVKLAVTSVSSGGASTTTTVTSTTTSAADTSGVMVLDGSNYRYNLSTKGFAVTAGVPAFYQESVSVAYKSAPSVVVGTDAIELDTK
jgi:hypothetical protein